MSALGWIFLIVLALTLLGSGTLLFITVKYYWGERGRPPLTGEERQRQKELELEMRRKQIERAERTPVVPRSQDFLDNRKRQ